MRDAEPKAIHYDLFLTPRCVHKVASMSWCVDNAVDNMLHIMQQGVSAELLSPRVLEPPWFVPAKTNDPMDQLLQLGLSVTSAPSNPVTYIVAGMAAVLGPYYYIFGHPAEHVRKLIAAFQADGKSDAKAQRVAADDTLQDTVAGRKPKPRKNGFLIGGAVAFTTIGAVAAVGYLTEPDFPAPGTYTTDRTPEDLKLAAEIAEDNGVVIHFSDPDKPKGAELMYSFSSVVSENSLTYTTDYPVGSGAVLKAHVLEGLFTYELTDSARAINIRGVVHFKPTHGSN